MLELNDLENIDKATLLSMNIVISNSAIIGKNVKLGSNVIISGKSIIEDNVEIGSNSHIENSHIYKDVKIRSSYIQDSIVKDKCNIGPFSHIRVNSVVEANCRIGNFVEIKNSTIGENSKCAHLSYVGDAIIGKKCNIGCGVVFCNYDGEKKYRTTVGDDCFIGSNTNIIAPIKISDRAYIAAGSTINKDIASGEFAIARARQENKHNFNNPYIKNLANKKSDSNN